MSSDNCLLAACRHAWDGEFLKGTKNSHNCSGFAKAVALALGVPLPATANADGLAEHLATHWQSVKDGADAARLAGTGVLVLAVLKSSEHQPARGQGHVAVVVAGPLYRERYPLVWGGSTGGAQSKGDKSVGEVWNRRDRDQVRYYQFQTPVCR